MKCDLKVLSGSFKGVEYFYTCFGKIFHVACYYGQAVLLGSGSNQAICNWFGVRRVHGGTNGCGVFIKW